MTQELSAYDLVSEPYTIFYNKVKNEGFFENEQALQSAVASMYIRYNQLVDRNPNFNKLIEEVKNHKGSAPINDAVQFIYADLMSKSKKAEMYINEKCKSPIFDFMKFNQDLTDYLYRNHIGYKIRFDIIPIEEE